LQKVLLSVLISALLFGGFTFLAYTGLFDLLEARFYSPAISRSISRENALNTETLDKFITEKQTLFAELTNKPAVRRAFLFDPDIEDIHERYGIFRTLVEYHGGLQWVRFIDAAGVRIHFSTYPSDFVRFDGQTPVFANYYEPFLPFAMIAAAGEAPRLIFDERAARILFSFPLYDYFDIQLGTALYSLSINAFADRLSGEGLLRFGHFNFVSVVSNPNGFLIGVDAAWDTALPYQVSTIWRESGERTARLFPPLSPRALVLFSSRTSQGIYVGRLVNEEVFSMPQAMQLIFMLSVFITGFLIIFLLFNFRQDPVAVVQNRIKHLQVSLVEQYYEIKGEADLSRWMRDMDLRRNEIITQLKRGVSFRGGDESDNIDDLINESWDELLMILGGRKEEGIDAEKFQSILERALEGLKSRQLLASADTTDAGIIKPSLLMKATAIVKELEETETVEELDEQDIAVKIGSLSLEDNKFSGEDISSLASEIEFSPDNEFELYDEEELKKDLEIVSPFAGMGFDFSQDEKDEADDAQREIIEELEGVPYINEQALNTGKKPNVPLNAELKGLVDSVIK